MRHRTYGGVRGRGRKAPPTRLKATAASALGTATITVADAATATIEGSSGNTFTTTGLVSVGTTTAASLSLTGPYLLSAPIQAKTGSTLILGAGTYANTIALY